jgi:hypothetical protein
MRVQSDIVSVDYSGPDGCSFSVVIGEPDFHEYEEYWYPTIYGMGLSHTEGEYITPVKTCFIPIPPGCEPVITCTPVDFQRVELPGPFLVTPVQTGSGLDTEWIIPLITPSGERRDYAELKTMHIAGTTVAAVTVDPFASGDNTRIPSEFDIRLEWLSRSGTREIDNPLLSALCLPSLVYWPNSSTRATSQFWGLPWVRIAISSTGPYSVTGDEFAQAGCDVIGVPSSSLRMFGGPGTQFDLMDPGEEHSLSEIAIEVDDGGDGIFDQSDTLRFFAWDLNRFAFDEFNKEYERLHHRYATHNVYWLTWGGEDGLRMDTLDATPDGSPAWGDSLLHSIWQEQDYIWAGGYENSTGWVWSMLYENIPGYFYFSSSSVEGDGRLAISLISSSYGDHDVSIQLNGDLIADTSFNGRGEEIFVFEGLTLDPSMNLLKVTALNDPGTVYFNYFQVDYHRRLSYAAGRLLRFTDIVQGRYTFSLGGAADSYSLLDVSDPFATERLKGSIEGGMLNVSLEIEPGSELWLTGTDGYLSPDSLLPAEPGRIIGTGIQGDIALVVADELLEAAEPLETIYGMRGLSTVMVTTGEVYNEFGQGLRDPGAIRSFFRYTQDSWDEPAQALVLVGDGSYDPLMHVTSTPTMIPACIELTGADGNSIDDFYVIAHDDGEYPETPLSRISVSSLSELAAYLSKLMLYELSEPSGQWANRILLTADDDWNKSSGNEYAHTLACEILADSILPKSLDRVKFYLIEYPWPPGTTTEGFHPEKPQAREDLVEELTMGYANMIYFGHGSYGQIAQEKLLLSSDVQRIYNEERQPLMIFATCDIGHFDMISADCMAEEFALKAGGGSIASIAATRGTMATANTLLFSDYYATLFSGDDLSAGTSLWLAKMSSGTGFTSSFRYVFFGDGGVCPVFPSSEGCSFEVSGDSLIRGIINTVSGSLQNSSAAFLNISESGRETEYTTIGGSTIIQYLRYGSSVYQGLVTGTEGNFTVPFFMPVQADTGFFSRGSAVGISNDFAEVAFREWVSVVDNGIYADDSLPPELELWIEGHRGEDNPVIHGNAVLRASASDSSGICAMGGGAGRSILMSLDSQGFDISRYFTYRPDSHTHGEIEYTVPELADGSHRIILVVWDGMGNSTRDTLDFAITGLSTELLSSVFVYPNPGSGQRCFSFETATSGTASVTVYTISGRAIWRKTMSCGEGYNQIIWDGLDTDGDEPASGAYIFRIEFSDSEGASSSVTDVLAVIRQSGR